MATLLRRILPLTLGLAPLLTMAAASADTAPSGGETPWRYVGVRPSTAESCPRPPAASGWQTSDLFPGTENREMRRFCLYERPDGGPSGALQGLALSHLHPDVMGVAPQGSHLADATWKALEADFLRRVGQVDLPATPAPVAPVRLVVVDAAPSGEAQGATGPEDVAASSPHGPTLLNMARDLVCNPQETICRAVVASRLALAWRCFDENGPGGCRDATRGGYVGLIGELAQAIAAEVASVGSPRPRMVLNLSLGWRQELGGGETAVDAMPAPAQAVYRALEDAACRGVLPIAAAGNRDASSVPPRSGPFLPALWETRRAPSAETCRRLGVKPAPHLGPSQARRPLVYSVGGVEQDGRALDTTRPGGRPRLAAFADHAAVQFSGSSDPAGTLTGSSVASLVVSASAAAMWSYLPSGDPFALMASLYASGESLDRQADYCPGSPGCAGIGTKASEVRRITHCSAVAQACGQAGCQAPACPTVTPLDLGGADLGPFDTATQVDVALIDDALAAPQCGGEKVLYNNKVAAPAVPCPHRQFDGPLNAPWNEPQPESIPCPNCLGRFESPGMIYLEIDDTWNGPLTSATLRCGDTNYALGLGPLAAGDQVRLVNVPKLCLDAAPTFLSFTHWSDRAVLSPVRLCGDCD